MNSKSRWDTSISICSCGSDDVIVRKGEFSPNKHSFWVTCSKCGKIGIVCLSKEDAINAWNYYVKLS